MQLLMDAIRCWDNGTISLFTDLLQVRFDRHQIDLEKEAPNVETLRNLVTKYSETVGSGLRHFLLTELAVTLQVPYDKH